MKRLFAVLTAATVTLSCTPAVAKGQLVCSLDWHKHLKRVVEVQRQATRNAMLQSMTASELRAVALILPKDRDTQRASRESAAVAAEAVQLWKRSDDLLDQMLNHECTKGL
jgi:predicted nucleic acid-binding Zn ribbon protein